MVKNRILTYNLAMYRQSQRGYMLIIYNTVYFESDAELSLVKYGSRWNHSSHHSRSCVPRSFGLGTESIGMGI